jgi:glc operon protein GlcG
MVRDLECSKEPFAYSGIGVPQGELLMLEQPTLSYDEARRITDYLLEQITSRRKAGVIAVVDSHGELISLARMDGAPLSSITIAINKAYSAARERKPSHEIGKAARRADASFDIGYFGDAKFTGWGGGIPIIVNGQVAGAVGVSGLPQTEDIELAEAAARMYSDH